MNHFRYLLAYLSAGLAIVGLTQFGWLTWLLPIYAFVLIPLLELFTTGSTNNLTEEEEQVALNNGLYDWLIYLIVPIQWGLVLLFLWTIQEPLHWGELIGRVFTLGLACGVFGINVAHELGHRVKKSEQFMAKALLLSAQYMHFFIEHNRGHHKNVSTDKDPATSRYGEVLYLFWFRSVIMGYLSAWKLENIRLERKGEAKLSIKNEMIQYLLVQLIMLLSIYLILGGWVLLLYSLSALIGILLLETVNYIEHYGLTRKRSESGNFKPVKPHHSWNSNHSLGRGILFELSRHSDHHYRASRKYQVLRHFDDSPQMPTGYPGMIVLALFPPFWFMVMNKRVNRWRTQYA